VILRQFILLATLLFFHSTFLSKFLFFFFSGTIVEFFKFGYIKTVHIVNMRPDSAGFVEILMESLF